MERTLIDPRELCTRDLKEECDKVSEMLPSDDTTALDRLEHLKRKIGEQLIEGIMADVVGMHGFFNGKVRIWALMAALKTMKENLDTRIFILDVDIKNLAGVNTLGNHFANENLLIPAALILKRTFGAIALRPEDILLIRHGGDEFTVIIANVTEAQVREAIEEAHSSLARHADIVGLNDVPHPKYPGSKEHYGTGFRFAHGRIDAGKYRTHEDILNDIDAKKEKKK